MLLVPAPVLAVTVVMSAARLPALVAPPPVSLPGIIAIRLGVRDELLRLIGRLRLLLEMLWRLLMLMLMLMLLEIVGFGPSSSSSSRRTLLSSERETGV